MSNGRNLLMLKKYLTSDLSISFFDDFYNKNILTALICSVNNNKSLFLRNILEKLNIKCLEVKKEIKLSIDSEYDLEMIGSDRLINIYAAKNLYDFPIIIASIGTAFTVDFINQKGLHEGGMISAGPETVMKALSNSTDALFKVKFGKIEKMFAKNTESALNSGILNTYSLFLEGLRKKVPDSTRIILTGGFSPLIKIDNVTVFPELIFQGLLSVYDKG